MSTSLGLHSRNSVKKTNYAILKLLSLACCLDSDECFDGKGKDFAAPVRVEHLPMLGTRH